MIVSEQCDSIIWNNQKVMNAINKSIPVIFEVSEATNHTQQSVDTGGWSALETSEAHTTPGNECVMRTISLSPYLVYCLCDAANPHRDVRYLVSCFSHYFRLFCIYIQL